MKPTINQIRALKDPLLSNNWALLIPKIPLQGSAFALPKDFNLRCESAETPSMTNETIETQIRQFTVNMPGISKPTGPITLTFTETIDAKMLNFFSAWERTCFDPLFGKSGTKRSKITDASSFSNIEAILTILNLNNNDEVVYGYNLIGCILESFSPGNLDNTTEIIKPSITIRYDYFTTSEFGLSTISDAVSSVINNFDSAESFLQNFGV